MLVCFFFFNYKDFAVLTVEKLGQMCFKDVLSELKSHFYHMQGQNFLNPTIKKGYKIQ